MMRPPPSAPAADKALTPRAERPRGRWLPRAQAGFPFFVITGLAPVIHVLLSQKEKRG
jgi:hypothetical protein